MKSIRIGQGYDVHRLVEGRKLVLGGVTIPYEKGLDGHSDADVLIHAIMDAILGAIAKTDIGHLFPDNDPAYLNISSVLLLEKVIFFMKQEGYHIGNIDATVIAQRPRLAPYMPEMKSILCAAMDCHPEDLNLKATTEEQLGFTGRGEGIAAQAVCLLEHNERQ